MMSSAISLVYFVFGCGSNLYISGQNGEFDQFSMMSSAITLVHFLLGWGSNLYISGQNDEFYQFCMMSSAHPPPHPQPPEKIVFWITSNENELYTHTHTHTHTHTIKISLVEYDDISNLTS